MIVHPLCEVAPFKLRDRQGAAIAAQIIKPAHPIVAVTPANRSFGVSLLAILDALETDTYYKPRNTRKNGVFSTGPTELLLGQGEFRRFPISFAANPLSLFVRERRTLLRSRYCVVTGVGLRPASS